MRAFLWTLFQMMLMFLIALAAQKFAGQKLMDVYYGGLVALALFTANENRFK